MLSVSDEVAVELAGFGGEIMIGVSSSSVPTGSISTSLQLAANRVNTNAKRMGNFLSVFFIVFCV
jgi:hypothetical protein